MTYAAHPETEADLMPIQNARARTAQAAWASQPVAERVKILTRGRRLLAKMSGDLAEAISPLLARTRADTLAAEVLPLLAACQFLESEADAILKPRRLGRKGLPFWLAGVESTVARVPFGVVLVIAPSNYPLLLPGVQVVQALAAGNAVVWKPGTGGRAVAEVFAAALDHAGLPAGLLHITDESVEAAEAELANAPDKVVFTGSGHAARQVLAACAQTLTPCVIEASGCDAVIVLPSADEARVLDALCFGMRLNGSATCMAPRRLLLVGKHPSLVASLRERFAAIDGVLVPEGSRRLLRELLAEARIQGAEVIGDADAIFMKPILVLNGRPELRIAQGDVFAPVLTVIACDDEDDVLRAQEACPFALTAAIFGEHAAAQSLSDRMAAGTVLINDLIVPTADPRVPFGGRRGSGFGVTRGREGLLEMTAVKTVMVRRGKDTKHYQATTPDHGALFAGVIRMSHGLGWPDRWTGLRHVIDAARRLK